MRGLRIAALLAAALALAAPIPAAAGHASGAAASTEAQPAQPPQQQEEFVPIDELPAEEQLPAAPMVVAAYGFIWVAFLAYVFTLIRRVRSVETELRRLEQDRRR